MQGIAFLISRYNDGPLLCLVVRSSNASVRYLRITINYEIGLPNRNETKFQAFSKCTECKNVNNVDLVG